MWYTKSGNMSDVVMSSRIRLARNAKDLPFVNRMKEAQAEKLLSVCKNAMLDKNEEISKEMNYVDLSKMDPAEKQALAEKHLVSPQMLADGVKTGLLLSNDEKISVMLNEEDHIRIQCMEAGFDFDAVFDLANKVDDILEKHIEYGFDEDLGYLTCCPTNVGTGMRASVMVHLPALVMTENMEKLILAINKLGMAVRGIYGEGSRAFGNIFQISNQVTLGMSEHEIIQRLTEVAEEVINKEREARKSLYESSKYEFEDKIMRSLGILRHARVMDSKECMKYLSDVRMGINMGIITDVPLDTIGKVMIDTMPANIVQKHNLLDAKDRDIKRAEILREALV